MTVAITRAAEAPVQLACFATAITVAVCGGYVRTPEVASRSRAGVVFQWRDTEQEEAP